MIKFKNKKGGKNHEIPDTPSPNALSKYFTYLLQIKGSRRIRGYGKENIDSSHLEINLNFKIGVLATLERRKS